MNKKWSLVYLAGIAEILWVVGLKHADIWYEWCGTILFILLSFFLLMAAAKVLPTATCYAVFTGIGAAGTNLMDFLVFGEEIVWGKILLIVLLLVGVIGLKMVTHERKREETSECLG